MRFVLSLALAFAFSSAHAITATKAYVDSATNATRTAVRGDIALATNATLTASKAYTDEKIAEVGGLTHEDATNAAVAVVQRDVPSWARQQTPPESMTGNALVLTNGSVKTKDGSGTVTAAQVGALSLNGGDMHGNIRNFNESVTPYARYDFKTSGNLYAGYSPGWDKIQGKVYANELRLEDAYDTSTGYWCDMRISPLGYFSFFDGGTAVGQRRSHYFKLPITPNTDENVTLAKASDIPNVPSWAMEDTKPTYTAAEVGAATEAYVQNANSNTLSIVQTWEGFLDGSNVVFSITNYISGAYNMNTAKLKIMEMRDGAYHEVYNSRDEIMLHVDAFKTNDFRVATNAIVSAVDAKVANKADRDWGKYTSAGGIAPSNTVYMTAPSTVFAGGLEYERVAVGEGMVGILTTHGAPVYTTGDEGTFKFQDDGGTNYFGFAKTDSYVIGCNTDGISVQNHVVTLTYNVTMSGVPCIWYCPTLDVQPLVWEQLNTPDGQPIAGASHTVTWEASPAAGTEVCYLNCPEAKGFFKATIEVAGSAKFMTNMPADLGGGIICTNSSTGVNGIIRPTFNGSTVNWTWSAE